MRDASLIVLHRQNSLTRGETRRATGESAIELNGAARYIVLVMIREFFDFLSFIALLVPWVLIITSFFM